MGRPKGKGGYFFPFEMPNLDDTKPGDYLTDVLTDKAIRFLSGTDLDDPFLLYFSYYTVHSPLMAPAGLVAKYPEKAKTFENEKNEFLNPVRAGMIESLDNSVGRIVAKLEEMGIADETLVILTGDNGGFSHEGGVREPLIARWPGKIPGGSTSAALTIGMDFYPTIL